MSVILYAARGLESVTVVIDAWNRQTVRPELELIVVCPERLPGDEESARAQGVVLSAGPGSLHAARATGIAAANGEWIFVAEDHCLPDTDAAERMLAAADSDPGWADIVVPALRAGDPRHRASSAAILIGYGQWLEPVREGRLTVAPGHNALVRRTLVANHGDLADDMQTMAFLMRQLLADGARAILVPTARLRHFDPPSWRFVVAEFACVGIAFGATRTRRWPKVARLAYPLVGPAVAMRHYARATKALRARPAFPARRIDVALLATLWGMFEGVGALLGPERVDWAQEFTEIKPLDLASLESADAYERGGHS